MSKKKVEVKSKNLNGDSVTVYVISPNDLIYQKAQKASNKAFSDALLSGAIFRPKLDNYMKAQGIWDEERQKELERIQDKIKESVGKLTDKTLKLTLDDARKIAIEIRRDRMEQTRLLSARSGLDEYTVEGQAENAKFDSLVVLCVLDEKGEQVFKDLEDYRSKNTEQYAIDSASQLAKIVYDLDPEWQAKLPENQFLKKFGFADEELRLINKEGKYVDSEGRLINKDGRLINEKGEFIDIDGNLISEDGYRVYDFDHFAEPKQEVVEDKKKEEDVKN